jgi:L-2,4-diaminobutyrate decarboxylase
LTGNPDDLTSARRRVVAAYDPRLLEESGYRLVGLLAAHLAKVQRSEGPVLSWMEPPDVVREAALLLREIPQTPDAPSGTRARTTPSTTPDPDDERGLVDHFERLVRIMLDQGLNLHDPRYIGHQVPASLPLAGLFDAVGSVTNQCMAIYEMGPWATAVERAMVEELGQAIGWASGSFTGAVTHGGSLANLTALLTARNLALECSWDQGLATSPRDAASSAAPGSHASSPALVTHADAHYSVARAAGILGLGSKQIVRIGLDSRGRMDPIRLDAELTRLRAESRPVVAVVACACATPTGAFDPLQEIAAVCRHHGVWLHVDAAHGGAALFSDRHRHLLAGLELADSVVWDAHKMLFVPALCAFVLYRQRDHGFQAFQQDAPYLFDPAAPGLAEYDSGVRTVECTKRAAAFGLWGVWSLFGRRLFADMVDITFALGRSFHLKLLEADDFVPLHEPECNIVVFRHVPAALRDAPIDRIGDFQLELRRRLIESGEFYIVPSKYQGVGALRVTIINPLTTPEHLDRLMDALRERGNELLLGLW